MALSLEFWDVFGRMPSLGIDRGHAQELALSMLWLVYALGLLGAGLWKKSEALRWQALVLLGVVIVKVFLFDLSFLEAFYRIVSFFLLGLALLVISFYYQRQLLSPKSGEKNRECRSAARCGRALGSLRHLARGICDARRKRRCLRRGSIGAIRARSSLRRPMRRDWSALSRRWRCIPAPNPGWPTSA